MMKKAKSAICKDVDKHYIKPEIQRLLQISTVLDPRFRMLTWMTDEEKQYVFDVLEEEMNRVAVEQNQKKEQIQVKKEPHQEVRKELWRKS